jgi:PEP-CTERM motif
MRKNLRIIQAVLIAAIGIGVPTAKADDVLFQDPLQTNSDLTSQWGPVAGAPGGQPGYTGSAVITSAPGGGNALTFGVTTFQGDIQTLNSFASTTGLYTLTFDFLGNCGHATNCGGFVNASSGPTFQNGWLISDTPYFDPIYGVIPLMPDTGNWEQVSYTFAATSPIFLSLETWEFSSFSGPDTAFFKNMVLTDDSSGVAPGTFNVSPVPEPATLSLLGLSLAFAGFMRRRKAT